MPAQRTTLRLYAREMLSPTVFRGDAGERLMQGTIALAFDMIAETFRQAVKSWLLSSRDYPSDALSLAGEDRALPRYAPESNDAYKTRLRQVWRLWAQAGTPQALKFHLELATGATVTVKENHSWNWDGDASKWARAWYVIEGLGYSQYTWGDGHTYGDPALTWGSTATPEQVQLMRSVVRKWKPAHELSMIIAVLRAGDWAGDTPPDGTWGDVDNRSDAAVYWNG